MELFILFLVIGAMGVFWINYILNKRDQNKVEETAPYKVEAKTEEATVPAPVVVEPANTTVVENSVVPVKVKKPRTKPAVGAKPRAILAQESKTEGKTPAKKPAAKKTSKVVTKAAVKRKA